MKYNTKWENLVNCYSFHCSLKFHFAGGLILSHVNAVLDVKTFSKCQEVALGSLWLVNGEVFECFIGSAEIVFSVNRSMAFRCYNSVFELKKYVYQRCVYAYK